MFKKPYIYAIAAILAARAATITHQPIWVQTVCSISVLALGVTCLIHAIRKSTQL